MSSSMIKINAGTPELQVGLCLCMNSFLIYCSPAPWNGLIDFFSCCRPMNYELLDVRNIELCKLIYFR